MKKIGIIGCGKIAQVRHIPELSRNGNAQIIGYYNPTTARAEQMAAKYGCAHWLCVEQDEPSQGRSRLEGIKKSAEYLRSLGLM